MKNQQGRRKVILSIIGIGDAFIGWNRTPQGVSFPIGAKIQVQMYKHEDGRWLVSKIVSIAGKLLNTQQTGKSNPRKKASKIRGDQKPNPTETQSKRTPAPTERNSGQSQEIVSLRNGWNEY